MKKKFKEISFVNNKSSRFQFDCISYQDLLKKTPSDHSQYELHRISFYGILLFVEQKGKYTLNFKDYNTKKGTLFTVRKDNIHKFYKSKAQGELLIFTEDFILNHSNKIEASKTFLLFNEMLASPKLQLDKEAFESIKNLVSLIKQEYLQASDDYSLSIIRNYLQIIITKLFRIKSEDGLVFENNKYLSLFLQFQSLVEKHSFQNKKVAYYAKEIGITSKTLNNATQSIIGKSAKVLINEIVIIKSKRLIINSTDSLTEIAFKVGFDDPTNFFKYFRKYADVTPSQFRENHQ